MQTVAARRVAAGDSGSSPDELQRLSLLSGTAVTLVALLLVPVAAAALDLEVVPTAMVAVVFLPLTLAGAALGLTQDCSASPVSPGSTPCWRWLGSAWRWSCWWRPGR